MFQALKHNTISAVAWPAEVEGHNHKGALKSNNNHPELGIFLFSKNDAFLSIIWFKILLEGVPLKSA